MKKTAIFPALLTCLCLFGCGGGTDAVEIPEGRVSQLIADSDLSVLDEDLFVQPTLEEFIGTWSDEESGTVITISSDYGNEDKPYSIFIMGGGDGGLCLWTIHAALEGDWTLKYQGAVKSETVAPEVYPEGDEREVVDPEPVTQYTDGSGSFVLSGETLTWTDEKEDYAAGMTFTREDLTE